MLGRSDPPFALEDAFPSDVFFPNDDYPPGFPCTSGCGQKFPTVIMQEIHIQHYCKGPYDEYESCLETSVAAFQTPTTSSDDDHDGIPQLPSSPGTSTLEPDPPAIPSHGAVPVDRSEDLKCFVCGRYLASRRNLRDHMASHDRRPFLCPVEKCLYHSAKSQGALDFHVRKKHPAVAKQRKGERSVIDHDGTPRLPSSPGTGDNSKDIQCPSCGKYLTRRQNLKAHIASHNSGKILCSSSWCHYSSNSQGAMDIHMRVRHSSVTDEWKPEMLACWYCGRNMDKKDQLERHVRHHNSGRFPCPIDNCPSKVMLTVDALDEHLNLRHWELRIGGLLLLSQPFTLLIPSTVILGKNDSGQQSQILTDLNDRK